jgi:predicted nucleic acid-binding protein
MVSIILAWKVKMTIYRIELLFPENMSEDLQESIEKIIKESPEPALPNMVLRLHKERLRYIPVIEFSAIHGVPAKKKEREICD